MRRGMFCVSAAALLVGTSGALAANDWGVISTSGSPDPIHVFDLADPAGTVTPFGNVATNFNRGMDFDSPNSFYYYVSTDSLNNPGDRGLWYWDNGVNTQLATQGFSDSGDGDATLSNDGQKFFVTTSDGDATSGDSLFVWSDLGGTPTLTEIGETGLEQLIGLAMDPVSGMLYGYDSSTEALYTLDLTDATPTLVGFSGETIAAIGGMDFSEDGSTLLLADDNDILFKINKNDGTMTPSGDPGVNISALSYRISGIPGPGALALLGVAGLLGRRRRR